MDKNDKTVSQRSCLLINRKKKKVRKRKRLKIKIFFISLQNKREKQKRKQNIYIFSNSYDRKVGSVLINSKTPAIIGSATT